MAPGILIAWPATWDCDFKLHAPHQIIVKGKVRAGKVTDLLVTPVERRADVEIHGEPTPR